MASRTGTPSVVWQRRTNRLIAAAVIVVGLTMMLSNITQCIYAGMIFIIISLISLAYMSMKDRKMVPARRPEDQPSPVLFLVTSHMLPRVNRPTVVIASDKPPSYDQIVTADGLPPEYSSVLVLQEKPPRYEDLSKQQEMPIIMTPGPSTSGHVLATHNDANNECYATKGENESHSYSRESSTESTDHKIINIDHSNNIINKSTIVGNVDLPNSNYNRAAKKSSSLPRHTTPIPINRTRKRNKSSNSSAVPVHNSADPKSNSLLRLQVTTLTQDTADYNSVEQSRTSIPKSTTHINALL